MLDPRGKPQSQAAFPVCIYDGSQDGYEIDKEGYGGKSYCNKFQTTFNEHGMCYTYNNYELSLDKEHKFHDQQHPISLPNVITLTDWHNSSWRQHYQGPWRAGLWKGEGASSYSG